jgi:hypothetical protein
VAVASPNNLFTNRAGLPEGFKPKSQFGYILGLGMDNVDMFYGQLEHFSAIWYIYSHLVYFIAIWYIL